MKKICCISQTNTPNYGAILQAFALKEYVLSLGHEFTLLNYENEDQRKKFSFWGTTEFMDWKYSLYKKIQYPINCHRIKKIVSFQYEYGNLSEFIRKSDLPKIKEKYDVFICGSDQIWNNTEVNHYDENFFLRFAEGKNTIAYAPSFGKTIDMLTQRDIDLYKDNIGRIRHISVREESGIKIVAEYGKREAQLVCDPVYLLSADEWKKIAVKPNRGKYILVYLIGNAVNQACNKKIMNEAKKLSKRTGLPLIKISRGLSSMLSEGSFEFPTTPEWLGLIADAEILVTNSFHGVSFAAIFNNKFLCFVDGAENNKMNTRIYSILKKLSLESQLISLDNPGEYYGKINIDFTDANRKMADFIEESKDFLIKSIEDQI